MHERDVQQLILATLLGNGYGQHAASQAYGYGADEPIGRGEA